MSTSDHLAFVVIVPRPKGATIADVKDFIEDSLDWAGGCRSPDDPLFSSLRGSTAKRMMPGRAYKIEKQA